jgi:hypothetical protein
MSGLWCVNAGYARKEACRIVSRLHLAERTRGGFGRRSETAFTASIVAQWSLPGAT